MDYDAFGVLAALGTFLFIIIGIALLIKILYILNLYKTMEEISPQNRKMESGLVWLYLIPLFGLVWHFIIVNKIADSLKDEFAERGVMIEEEKPGYNVGLACSILFACSIIPLLGGLASIGALITWIIYWVKIAGYKNQLKRSEMHLT